MFSADFRVSTSSRVREEVKTEERERSARKEEVSRGPFEGRTTRRLSPTEESSELRRDFMLPVRERIRQREAMPIEMPTQVKRLRVRVRRRDWRARE